MIRMIKLTVQISIFLSFALLFTNCSSLSASSTAENQSLQVEVKNGNTETIETETETEPAVPKKEVLWDFRQPEPEIPEVSKAETQAVLKYLFGAKANDEMTITSRVSGSFTTPNANETLYFITGCKENGDEGGDFTTDCPHVAWNTDGWIAIYNGTTPVLKINEALGYGVSKVVDVNGDGICELFTTVGYSQSGATETSGSLGHFKNGKYIDIKSFNSYYSNTCESGGAKVSENAAVISYVPQPMGKCPFLLLSIFKTNAKNRQSGKILRKCSFGGE